MEYEFCYSCGSLKERGKICKFCTNIIKTKEKSQKIKKDSEELFSLQKQKVEMKKEMTPKKPRKNRPLVRYSDAGGLDWYFDVEPDVTRTKLNFCVKCKQNKPCYSGWWVKAGGKFASEESRKRIFICTTCWSPHKKKED